MADRSFQMPSLQRDLAIVGAGLLAAALFIGGVIGVAVDVLVRRHRGVS